MNAYEAKPIEAYLNGNPYLGRGIVIGKSRDGGRAAIAYFITGRSENSRNRIFEIRDGVLYTKPFDQEKVVDPSLIIYAAMRDIRNNIIITNGDQTDTIFKFLATGKTFEEALGERTFEPDEPNYTSRISGLATLAGGDFSYKLSIIKSADGRGSACQRQLFQYPALAGEGHFLHTYDGDGEPLPPFSGEPKRVEIPESIDEFASALWNNLNEANRVSLYVRYVDLRAGTAQERMANQRLAGGR